MLFRPLHLHQYFATAAFVKPPLQNHFLVEFLINSLGFSREEALATTKKVKLWKSSRNDPNSVLNYFQTLGLSNSQLKILFSSSPTLLTSNVAKTLQPKVQILQEYGILGSDLVRVLINLKSVLYSGATGLRPRIDYVRNLLGSRDAVKAIKRYTPLISRDGPKRIATRVAFLQKIGFSNQNVARLIVFKPRLIRVDIERLEEISRILENDIGISRESKMFYHGIGVLCSLNKSKLEGRFEFFRNFGWSDEVIRSMIRTFPYVLGTSEYKIRNCWNFFVKELRYPPDYLASHPVIFSFSFEKRVKPRSEVLKLLNEKLKKKTRCLYSALCMTEPKFVANFLLPYSKEMPDVLESYFKTVGSRQTENTLV